jgi:hypothetical protein
MTRLRPLSEAECYLRCYGRRGAEYTVRIVEPAAQEPPRPSLLGDRIRLLFEAALEPSEPEAA